MGELLIKKPENHNHDQIDQNNGRDRKEKGEIGFADQDIPRKLTQGPSFPENKIPKTISTAPEKINI